MPDAPNAPTAPTTPVKKKRWTFLRIFRGTVYIIFIAFMLFMAVAMIVGIVGNLRERYRDLDVPVERPESLSDLGTLQLRDCLKALENLRDEQQEMVQSAYTGELDRDGFLAKWRDWSSDWRRRFEKLGVSCRLTEYRYDDHPTLGLLAEIYRHIEDTSRLYNLEIRRFIAENAHALKETSDLCDHARKMIEKIEAQPAP